MVIVPVKLSNFTAAAKWCTNMFGINGKNFNEHNWTLDWGEFHKHIEIGYNKDSAYVNFFFKNEKDAVVFQLKFS